MGISTQPVQNKPCWNLKNGGDPLEKGRLWRLKKFSFSGSYVKFAGVGVPVAHLVFVELSIHQVRLGRHCVIPEVGFGAALWRFTVQVTGGLVKEKR